MNEELHSFDERELDLENAHDSNEQMSIEQLQRLVQLLDASNVSEIELNRKKAGSHLVLRKAKATPESTEVPAQSVMLPLPSTPVQSDAPPKDQTTFHIVAPLVGIFHAWAKPKGGTLVAVGDIVKVGQLVGTIQSLNVINEVETSKAGRVVEILVQEGQAVEYGQHLMTINIAEGA